MSGGDSNILNFCTLFNKNYLTRGLVAYKTLMASEPNAFLYIFAFDDETFDLLTKLRLEQCRIISLSEFEDPELLAVKPTRSFVEYCWTCTPSVVLFAIEKFNLSHCTYIDSDLYFLNSPKAILNEIPENCSILLTEHRYTKAFDQTEESGRFCVQFMTFKATDDGLSALRWWRERCIEWCFFIAKDGKFGDQGYIQDWDTRFGCAVHIMESLGGGLAPWNIQQYNIVVENNNLMCIEVESGRTFEPIFYHFHYLRFYTNAEMFLTGYPITHLHKAFIYYPYIKMLEECKFMLSDRFALSFDPHGSTETKIPSSTLKRKIYNFAKRVLK